MPARFLTMIVLLLTLFSVSVSQAEEKRPPNIVFIMVDDLGKDWIGCYGADNIETPHIDALADQGMKFHNVYSMPQCTPTRTTLLTGQYPYRTGWTNHWDVPRWGVGYFDWEKNTSFPQLLQAVGYKTAIAGKWQINDFRVEPEALKKHGFDDWCVWTGYEAGNKPSAERYWDPYIHTREGSKTYNGKFGPDLYCDFLVEFIQQHRDEPHMVYFPMALTHGPLVHTPDEPNASSKEEKQKAMVGYTDKLVGRIVNAYDELGLRENTVLIFTTDNGSGGGVRGTVGGVRPSGGKASNFEGGVCEPFIVSQPGKIEAGVESDALVDFSDLLPTFCELAGAKISTDLTIDGKSFAPLLSGRANDSPRDWILAMGHGPAIRDADGVRGRTDYMNRVIRDKQYKVWTDDHGQIIKLFDLKKDPAEKHNLLSEPPPAAKESLAKFHKVLAEMPEKDARPMYRPRASLPWDKPIQSAGKKPAGKKRKKK
jgi:arylsulfatase A-like enzyme